MKRRLFTILSALSLLLLVAVVVLWVRSHARHGRVGFSAPGERWTLHSCDGRLTLMRPPIFAGSDGERWDLIAKLRDGRVLWVFSTGTTYCYVQPHVTEVPYDTQNKAALWRPLLHALEDPETFVGAHLVLAEMAGGNAEKDVGSDDGMTYVLHGLRINLPRVGTPKELNAVAEVARHVDDPEGQRRAVRDYWHDRLDTRVGSAPYWAVAVLTLVLPATWFFRSVRRGVRVRLRRCPSCGYDVRATPDRCPECGTHTRVAVVRALGG